MLGHNIWAKQDITILFTKSCCRCAATQTGDSFKVMRAPHSSRAPSPAGTISQTPAFERVVLPAFPVSHIWNERTNSPMEQSNARWEWFRYEVTVRDWAERSAASASGRHETDAIAGNIYSHSWMNLCWQQKNNRTAFPSTGNYWKDIARWLYRRRTGLHTKDSKEETREESFPTRKQTGRNSAEIVTHKPCTGCTAWDSSSGVVRLKGMPFWWLSSTKVWRRERRIILLDKKTRLFRTEHFSGSSWVAVFFCYLLVWLEDPFLIV